MQNVYSDESLKSHNPNSSVFNKACKKLGFDEPQQKALLEIFYLSRYFNRLKFLNDLKRSGVRNANIVFEKEYKNLHDAHALQGDFKKFDASLLNNVLFQDSGITEREILNLIVYQAQNAFGRKVGEERNSIKAINFSRLDQLHYIDAARVLNLIERPPPFYSEYDEVWIAGASRYSMLLRVLDFEYIVRHFNIQINGQSYILAGERQLSPSLDGVSPELYQDIVNIRGRNLDEIDFKHYPKIVTQQSKDQLIELAQRYGVKLNQDNPFIENSTKFLFNYTQEKGQKLTETLAAKDILYQLDISGIDIVDTQADGHKRPDTATTIKDAIYNFIGKICYGQFKDKKAFVILLQTNNPHVERQTLVAQREVDNALIESKLIDEGYQVIIEGVGFSDNNRNINIINSELASLIAEKWRNISKGVDGKHLFYQTRSNI